MAAIADLTVWDGTHPTAVSRTFKEKGCLNGVARWAYEKTSSISGWYEIRMWRGKPVNKAPVRVVQTYFYLPTLATVDGKDVLIRYSDCTIKHNVHNDSIEQERRDLCAMPASFLAKPESSPGALGAAVVNDSFPS